MIRKFKSICRDINVVSDRKQEDLILGDTYFIYEETLSTGESSTMAVCYYTKEDIELENFDMDGPTGPSLPWLIKGIGFEKHFYDEWEMRELKINHILNESGK